MWSAKRPEGPCQLLCLTQASLPTMGWPQGDIVAALQGPKVQTQPRGTAVRGSEQNPDTHPGDWSVRTKAAIFMQGLLRQSSVTYFMCWTGVSHNWKPGEDIHGRETAGCASQTPWSHLPLGCHHKPQGTQSPTIPNQCVIDCVSFFMTIT